MQLQLSMVKLGVILVPGKHGILLLGPIPARMGFTMLPPDWQALLLILPCLAGGDNQHLFLSELQTPNTG